MGILCYTEIGWKFSNKSYLKDSSKLFFMTNICFLSISKDFKRKNGISTWDAILNFGFTGKRGRKFQRVSTN